MAEIKGVKGARIVINEAPFEEAIALKDEIEAALLAVNISLPKLFSDTMDLFRENNLKGEDTYYSEIFKEVENAGQAVMAINSSKKVRSKIFSCLARCTYNDAKITENTFTNAEAKADYSTILLLTIKENVLPFYALLL